ncbi:MAG: phosphatase PAP2 family protein [Prevotella sp.]|nr:phosphatase PAP2 family protein [Prevotella sp.]
MEPLKLEVPEMKPELVAVEDYDLNLTEIHSPASDWQPDFDIFKSKTNPNVKEYKFIDDLTFVGVPLFVAGIIAKAEKNSFRQNSDNTHANTRLIPNFKSSIDDYTQYFGPVTTVGLKLAGYEGRSDWPRLLASAAMSYGLMAALVNGIKYTASEMRPDGSTANSWPSGHTATSFVGATLLHKEYGLTRSPWFSVAGYGVATATGVMRILNNRHWISDVLSGAGIGIMSTELGYAICDVLFKGKGLLRNNLIFDDPKPSFFSISMGMSLGLKSLEFPLSSMKGMEGIEGLEDIDGPVFNVDFHTATAVDAEGAYFFNKYIGVGGRLRVRAMTAKGWSDFIKLGQEDRKSLGENIINLIKENSEMSPADITREMADITTDEQFTVESDHLTEFSANVGLYFNLPLSEHFSLGTKALIGRTMTQELDINAHFKGNVKESNYWMLIEDGEPTALEIFSFKDSGYNYDEEWDYITMGGNNSTTYGTGLSLTYRYKSNFLWKLYADYDYSRKTFTFNYDPNRFLEIATPNVAALYSGLGFDLTPYVYEIQKSVNYFTFGIAFAVNF